jgi:hypothetical protein
MDQTRSGSGGYYGILGNFGGTPYAAGMTPTFSPQPSFKQTAIGRDAPVRDVPFYNDRSLWFLANKRGYPGESISLE